MGRIAFFAFVLVLVVLGLASILGGNSTQYDSSYVPVSVDKQAFAQCVSLHGLHVELWDGAGYCNYVGTQVRDQMQLGKYGFAFIDDVTGEQLASGVVQH